MGKSSTLHSTPDDPASSFQKAFSPRATMATPIEMMLRDKKRSLDFDNIDSEVLK